LLRSLTLLSLFTYLATLAVTQTAYGESFSVLRWFSLFALAGFGGLNWVVGGQRSLRLNSVNICVLIYLVLWGLTVINGEYPLFSSYRWFAHAMIVVSALIFLPQVLRMTDASKVLLALKLIVAVILLVSYLKPASATKFDDPELYRGILGNPNALGHMAAVGCLLFLHGFLTQKGTRWGQLQAAMAGLAGVLLLQSGARSSGVAFLGGFLFLYVFYKAYLSRYLMLAVVAASAAFAVVPDLPENVSHFVFKKATNTESTTLERLTLSRHAVWERNWKGFEERPLLGWGFGMDSDSNLSNWNGEWKAVGWTGRDTVNDIMYVLESGGVVGLFAYVFVLGLIFKAWIPGALRPMLRVRLRGPQGGHLASVYEVQKAFYCLTVLLMVMFEFDNTALSAGNFFSALFWASMGLSLGLYAMLMSSLRRPAPIPSALQSHIAVLPAE